MRGGDDLTGELFSYVDLEARVRRDHPLRAIRLVVSEALSALERVRRGNQRESAASIRMRMPADWNAGRA
ncbi:hypothetical protein HNQ71_007030 [Mesorhizobium sangaii]|uniref:Transposase n=1 Tax=Mesorhizobium sangaii TaxID=505389 RepID=A0A841PUU6_9HYPH|nr:hypothetical protein [Mesorhizobium sangaii]